jgi:hypothetical protein
MLKNIPALMGILGNDRAIDRRASVRRRSPRQMVGAARATHRCCVGASPATWIQESAGKLEAG